MKTRALLLLIGILSFSVLKAQEPTKWRGDNQNGIYPDKGLLNTWPASGPEIIWAFEGLGEGHSSPAFANGKIYLTSMVDKKGYLFVLSEKGKLLNKFQYGDEFHESFPGARTTPVVVGDLVYTYSGFGEITCLNETTGAIKWQKNILEHASAENIRWGVTETLLINGDMLYVTPGGNTKNVIALNRITGDEIWACPGLGELSAYCTPLLVKLSSRDLLVTHTASHILGIDAATGQLLWNFEQPNRWSVHANTPVYHDGAIACVSGYGHGTVKLNLNADGSQVTKEWFTDKLDNRMGGAVYVDGYLYASGDKSRGWHCIDWKTGEEKWATKDLGNGNVIYADGKLICYTDKGELALVKATPDAFTLLSQAKVEKGSAQHWAHTVINNGVLYLRHGDALVAYKIK